MARTGGTRGSPRIHHDGPESFPVNPDKDADMQQVTSTKLLQQQPAAMGLDATRLRRLSFGGRSAANKNILPALDRPRAVPPGPLAPLPAEKPKFHHGDARPKLPKVLAFVRFHACLLVEGSSVGFELLYAWQRIGVPRVMLLQVADLTPDGRKSFQGSFASPPKPGVAGNIKLKNTMLSLTAECFCLST